MSTSLRQQAYTFIQGKIISGELAAGSRVSEQQLAEELGISRTPVRSAIRELETKGLVEQVPRYGTIVKRTDRRELEDIYEFRIALESYAAEKAVRRIASEDLGLLNSLCEQVLAEVLDLQRGGVQQISGDKLESFVNADIRFHMIILRATGNRRIMKSVSDSRLLSHAGHTIPHTPEMIASYWRAHRTIAQRLTKKDGEGARWQMAEHIAQARDGVLAVFDRMCAEHDADDCLKHNSFIAE